MKFKLWQIAFAAVVLSWGTGCDSSDASEGELSSRLVGMTVPDSPELARSLGCALLGHHVGSSLGSLLSLSGGLDRFFEVDYYGEVAVIILAQTDGFQSGSEGPFQLKLFEGAQDKNLDFVGASTQKEIGGNFEGMALDPEGWFSVETDELRLPIPVLDDLIVYPPLASVSLEGKFVQTQQGFDTERLLLKGYITEAGIMELVEKIIEVCGLPPGERPNICPVISNQITGSTPPEEAFPIFVSFMGGFDVKVVDGHPQPCSLGNDEVQSDCNAVSVCMDLEMASVQVLN